VSITQRDYFAESGSVLEGDHYRLAVRLGPEPVALIRSIRPDGDLVTVLDEPETNHLAA
jgi:hypothetical protein